MSSSRTFLPPDVLERSRERERLARQRRGGKRLAKLFRHTRFERRDALVVLLLLVALGALLSSTRVLDRWFDRFNSDRPDQAQAADALVGQK